MSVTNVSLPLHGMWVICLRPRVDQAAVAPAVRARGGRPLALPGLRLVAAEDRSAARQALQAALACAAVVFTSPAAVRFAARLMPLRSLRAAVFAPGRGTAEALRGQGVEARHPPDTAMHSEGLLALPAFAAQTGPVGLIGAPGGRDAIAQGLQARGVAVHMAHVYRRLPPRWRHGEVEAVARATGPAAVLVTSGEALEQTIARLPPPARVALLHAHAVVSSPRLAALARTAGFADVLCADSPTTDAMLDVLAQWKHGSETPPIV